MRSSQDPALLKAFAAELKARRAVRGFNQEELGFASGLNRTFIAKLETATTSPSLTSLIFLCNGLEVEPSELMSSLMKRYKKELRTKSAAE
ncbi:helix-turn-helix domain-containing protein [Variovorax paradoxus]|uniref:Helix-turn-helix protein n=1 Tax=Variovorax paradoxus TaxID=34073 RepID=A0A0H2LXU5_VARPD|nr:helix-turn-helix transcriptional regulator [Variovorax paradoxus]KLN53317.1 helix-turn-helix protein [Variovorax paradoxus]